MSLDKVRIALEKHADALLPQMDIAGENVSFTPTPNVPYQQFNLLPAAPDNPSVGDGYYRESGIFQITLCYPQNVGSADAIARANSLQAHFRRGLVLQQSGVKVVIERTPAIGHGSFSGDRWRVPISIRWFAEFFS